MAFRLNERLLVHTTCESLRRAGKFGFRLLLFDPFAVIACVNVRASSYLRIFLSGKRFRDQRSWPCCRDSTPVPQTPTWLKKGEMQTMLIPWVNSMPTIIQCPVASETQFHQIHLPISQERPPRGHEDEHSARSRESHVQ